MAIVTNCTHIARSLCVACFNFQDRHSNCATLITFKYPYLMSLQLIYYPITLPAGKGVVDVLLAAAD